MYIEAVTFVIAIFFLVKGADYFVQAASDIATKLGASKLIVGLTLVALGTSIPELAASLYAAYEGSSGLILGSIIGSNIANIALIAGISVTVTPIIVKKRLLRRDGYIMLLAASMLYLFLIDGAMQYWEGIVSIILYIAYLLFLIESRGKEDEEEYDFTRFFRYFISFKYVMDISDHLAKAASITEERRAAILRDVGVLILGGAAVILGARYTVIEAIYFAQLFSVPETIIGFTMIALGTSLPELTVTLSAAKKGFGEIVLGNVIGSNIANVLLVGGITSLVIPIKATASILIYTAPFMLFLSVLFLVFIATKWKLERGEGITLLLLYILFLLAVILRPIITS